MSQWICVKILNNQIILPESLSLIKCINASRACAAAPLTWLPHPQPSQMQNRVAFGSEWMRYESQIGSPSRLQLSTSSGYVVVVLPYAWEKGTSGNSSSYGPLKRTTGLDCIFLILYTGRLLSNPFSWTHSWIREFFGAFCFFFFSISLVSPCKVW